MKPLRIAGETRVMGGPAAGQPEYFPLSIRDMPAELTHGDGRRSVVNAMVSAWQPTPEELAQLNAGAPVFLSILGDRWPPSNLWVGETPIGEEPGQ